MSILFTLFLAASATLPLPVTETTLSCESGRLALAAPDLEPLVTGTYPGFVFMTSALDHACFFRNYVLDVAADRGGRLDAAVDVQVDERVEPIYECRRVCPFCDPECEQVGERTIVEERVYLDVHGLRFFGKSELPSSR